MNETRKDELEMDSWQPLSSELVEVAQAAEKYGRDYMVKLVEERERKSQVA